MHKHPARACTWARKVKAYCTACGCQSAFKLGRAAQVAGWQQGADIYAPAAGEAACRPGGNWVHPGARARASARAPPAHPADADARAAARGNLCHTWVATCFPPGQLGGSCAASRLCRCQLCGDRVRRAALSVAHQLWRTLITNIAVQSCLIKLLQPSFRRQTVTR